MSDEKTERHFSGNSRRDHRFSQVETIAADRNIQFGGNEARKVLEKKLLRKLDLRMSIMVVIYILSESHGFCFMGCSC
jgi:hypothetical protein